MCGLYSPAARCGQAPLRGYGCLAAGGVAHLWTPGAAAGAGGRCYWPLKATASAAAHSLVAAYPGVPPTQLVLVPLSLTGLRDLLDTGALYVVDAAQYRLYAPLQMPSPADSAGNAYYVLHPETSVGTERRLRGTLWWLSPHWPSSLAGVVPCSAMWFLTLVFRVHAACFVGSLSMSLKQGVSRT